jgi:protein-serine/threonine kinase
MPNTFVETTTITNSGVAPSIAVVPSSGGAISYMESSTAQSKLVPKKAPMTKRLTRMFSTRDGVKDNATRTSGTRSGTANPISEVSNSNPATRPPPSRQNSSIDKPTMAVKNKERPKEVVQPLSQHERFVLVEGVTGGHEHHLKSTKRQEKLLDMLRDVLAGKKKAAEVHKGEQELSLISSWVDQLKREQENLAIDKKGGPNSIVTLVEKYGKCEEIVGRGAFGIVQISHK